MDPNASSQGQGANANTPEINRKIDNDTSQPRGVCVPNDVNFAVNSDLEERVADVQSTTSGNQMTVKTSGEPQPQTVVESKQDDLICFNLRSTTTKGSVQSTTEGENSNPIDKTNQFIPSTLSSQNNIDRCEDNMEPTSSIDGDITKQVSPQRIMDGVTKLNISGEEPKIEQLQSPPQVVVNKETESWKNLLAYEGDSDSEHSDAQVQEETVVSKSIRANSVKTWRKNEENVSGTSDSESDSSTSTLSSESESDSDNSDGEFNNSDGDSASVIDASDDGIRTESPVLNKSSDKGAVKKTNTSVIDFQEFLPPIPDLSKLTINVKEEFMHIGKITAIISELVTIEAIRGTPSFDLDSMLFIDDQTNKKPIGPIFDVLGPVSEPIYCVRFNNEDEIKNLGLKSGMKVFAAHKNDEFTKYVFVKQLMSMKGTDASWLNDQEQPTDMADFSDDELERQAKRAEKSAKRKLDDSSLERHKRYEKTMNHCNTLNTRVCKLMDAHKNLSRQIRPNSKDDQSFGLPPGYPELPRLPTDFNPTVPPPGFGHPSPYSNPSQGALFGSSPSAFGQPSNFSTLPSYGNGGYGAHAVFTGPAQFGSFYANQPPFPQSLGPPPTRWHQSDNFRRGRHTQRTGHRQNSDNYFTNNSRNLRGAGPSYQPF